MKRKISLILLLTLLVATIAPVLAYATTENVAKVGDKEYATLEEAVNAAGKDDAITLINDAKLSKTLLLNDNKEITINLNNHNISASNIPLRVQGAKVTLEGKGTIQEDDPCFGAVLIKGSENENDTNYSVVNVGKDVTLTGWAGIFIDQLNGKDSKPFAYGVVVNCDGTIKSVEDSSGYKGSGIYLNGSVKHINNAPTINLTSNAKISSEGNGIYAAGYGLWNIEGATINGSEAGLGIKSGVFKLNNVKVTSDGADVRPTEGWGSGINPSGSALQIESNKEYAGKIDLTINGGTYTSKNGAAFYEYLDTEKPTTATTVEKLNIKDATFISKDEIVNFDLSKDFKSKIPTFIESGIFTSDVSDYVINGNVCKKIDDKYIVGAEKTITIASTENGTVKADKTKALVGETISLDIKANEGYEVKSVTVLDSNKKEVTVKDNKFTMPKTAVTVTVEFTKLVKETEIPAVDTNKESKDTSVGVSNIKETENTLLNSLENDKELSEKTKDINTKIEVVVDNNVTLDSELENKIKDFLKEKLKNAVLADTFDITIAVTNKDNNEKIGNITELTDEIEITVMLSDELRNVPEGYTRKYYITREHNSEIEILDTTLTENELALKFKTDKFSTYGITYVDTKIEDANNNNSTTTSSNNPKTGDNIVTYISIFAFSVVGIAIMKKTNTKRGRHSVK